MNLNFKHVHIENFMSFKEEDINFNKNGYTLVRGINNNPDDSADSNGSGKSSLFESIMWGLCGETVRGTKDVCNMFTDNGCLVELVFEASGKEFKIIRTKDYKPTGTSLKLFIDNEDRSGKGIRETEKVISHVWQQKFPHVGINLHGKWEPFC